MSAMLDALNAVLEQGTPDPILPFLAPAAILWHNDDKVEMDAASVMRQAPRLHAMLDGVRIEVVRRSAVADGWMQQFILHGTVPATGQALAVHRAIVLVVADGLITRLEEYIDPTFAQQLGLAPRSADQSA